MATSIDAVSSDKVEALLQCSICLEALNNPRTLPCFHSYCKCCLERFVNNIRENKPGANLTCPFCRSEFTLGQEGVEGMTSNHFICNMLEVMAVQDRVKGIPCSHCQKPSVGRCVTCEVFMCEKCFQPHNSYPGFRDHCVLTMEELSKHENRSKITGSSYCKEHESKKLKFFCETCEQLICRYCMDFDHLRHNHECLPLDKVVAQKKDALKVCCETLGRNLNESNEALQDLRNVAISLEENAKQAKDDVRQQQTDILTAVERMLGKQVETVIDDIDTTFNNKHGAIVEHIKEVEIYVNKVKSFVDVSNSLLENGNGEEIVSSQKMINDNSEMLKTERLKHIGQTKHDDTISYTRQPIDDLQIEELLEKVGTVHDAVRPNDAVRRSDAVRPARVIAGKSKMFTAYVYENDYAEIQKLVQQYPNIETGGDLFGLWQDDKSVVIQLFIGPGKYCKRTTSSFYQDVAYLEKVGAVLTKEEGLCNVGEWHSHHQMGMPSPSEGDKQTVLSNMPQLGFDRFLLFIASIESSEKKKCSNRIQLKDTTLRCFMYQEGLRREDQPVEGKIVKIKENNPVHLKYKARQVIAEGAEPPPKDEAVETKKERKRKENKKQESFGSKPPARNQSGPRYENTSPNSGWKEKPSDQRKADITRQTTQPASLSYPSSQSPTRSSQGQLPSSYNQPHSSQGQYPSNQSQPRSNLGQGIYSQSQPRSSQGQVSPSSQRQPRSNQGQDPNSLSQLRSNQVQGRSNQGQGTSGQLLNPTAAPVDGIDKWKSCFFK